MLSLLRNPPFGFKLWGGEEVVTHGSRVRRWICVPDRSKLYKLLANPGLYMGEYYSDGSVQIEGDLWSFLLDLHASLVAGDRDPSLMWKLIRRPAQRRPSTPEAAKDNIHQHYDLGNEFYQLWLDKAAMQYTCAYFARPDMTLEQAQIAKLDHVCRKLQLKPGDTVVEAGWAADARHGAQLGVTVKAGLRVNRSFSRASGPHGRPGRPRGAIETTIAIFRGDPTYSFGGHAGARWTGSTAISALSSTVVSNAWPRSHSQRRQQCADRP
jgi:hypothetical protein